MKQSCPKCKTIIEINEKEYVPGSVVKKLCPLCGGEVTFTIGKNEPVDAAAISKVNEELSGIKKQLEEMQTKNKKMEKSLSEALETVKKQSGSSANNAEQQKRKKISIWVGAILLASLIVAEIVIHANYNNINHDEIELSKAMEDRVSDEAIERCKTIIAYYFNQAVWPEQFKEKDCPAEWTLNDVLAQLRGTQETSIALTKEIAAIEPTDNSLAAVEDAFTLAIYQDKSLSTINSFLNWDEKRKSDIENIKPTIDSEIKVILHQDEIQRKEAFKQQQLEYAMKSRLQAPTERSNQIIVLLGLILLGVIVIGLGCFFYIQIRKMQEIIRKQKGRVKELREQVREMESMKTTINGLKSNLGNLRNEMDERLTQLNHSNLRTAEVSRDGLKQPAQAAPKRPIVPTVIAEPQVLYAVLPSRDVFTDAKAQSTPNSFYKIVVCGKNMGEYEFISNPTTINYAINSPTSFIECACNIVKNTSEFNNVITTRKGKVIRSGNDWIIVEKAEVQLT